MSKSCPMCVKLEKRIQELLGQIDDLEDERDLAPGCSRCAELEKQLQEMMAFEAFAAMLDAYVNHESKKKRLIEYCSGLPIGTPARDAANKCLEITGWQDEKSVKKVLTDSL